MIIDQGNTFLCASYCFAYALMDKFGIMLDVNWLPGMRQAFNATLDGHLHVLQAFGALPEGEYTLPPFPLRAQAQDWCKQNKTTLLKAAAPYKVAEWRQVVTADELYDALGSGWYGVFIASQYHTEKHVGGYYYPYAGKDYAGAHAMSVWLKDGKLWVWNTRGPDWGDGGGAYIHDSDVLKGGECYIFRFTPEEKKKGEKPMVKEFTSEQKGLRLTEHYTVGDFWAFDGHKKIKLDTTLAEIFEKMYAHFGTLPRLRDRDTAGYRDSLNWTGSKTSQHCYGKGADVWIPGVPAYRLAQFVETLSEVGGIGLYLAKSGELEKITHIHVDTRDSRARWGWNNKTSGTNTPGFGGVPCVFKYNSSRLQRSAAIEDIQLHLNALGFACGTPDGVYGKKTRDGVKAFQQAKGLKADGIYGRDTNAALGLFDW